MASMLLQLRADQVGSKLQQQLDQLLARAQGLQAGSDDKLS